MQNKNVIYEAHMRGMFLIMPFNIGDTLFKTVILMLVTTILIPVVFEWCFRFWQLVNAKKAS